MAALPPQRLRLSTGSFSEEMHYLVGQTALSSAPKSGQSIDYWRTQTFSGAEILTKAQSLIFPYMVSRTELF